MNRHGHRHIYLNGQDTGLSVARIDDAATTLHRVLTRRGHLIKLEDVKVGRSISTGRVDFTLPTGKK